MDDNEFCRRILSIYRTALHFANDMEPELLIIISGRYEKSYVLQSGAYEILEFLREANIKLGIVSNNSSNIKCTLNEMNLTGFFRNIIISDEVGLSKPNPQILRLACELIEADNTETIYIGDHPFDILCAHSANMDIGWLRQNKFCRIPEYIDSPDYTFSNLTEVKKLFV